MKNLAVILVFIGMLVQSFNKLFIVMDYQLNRDYIAKNLCENRSKPIMHCNGKCHMMKLMKQDEKKDQENPERKSENKFEIVCFSNPSNSIEFYQLVTLIDYPAYQENIFTGFISSSFHPPQV